MNLNILPLASIQPVALQKCLIPCEKFADNIRPGNVCRCRLSSGKDYICRVYPMDNDNPRNYCALDEKVMISEEFCEISDSPKLMDVEKLENIGIVDRIVIIITVNIELFSLFKVSKSVIVESVRNLIRPLYLTNGCTIIMDEWGKSIGITTVQVEADGVTEFQCFKITDKTDAFLKSIHIVKLPNLKYTHFENLNKTQEELNKLTISLEGFGGGRFSPSSNVLLFGPAGSGKTSMCHNFFLENKCNVFEVKPSNIFSQHPGEAEEILRQIFSNAQIFVEKFRPKDLTVIFIEDIDLLCPARTHHSKTSSDANLLTEQLVVLLDKLKSSKSNTLKVLATTSRVDLVNPILRCPGRLDREIYIPILNELERLNLTRNFLLSNFANEDKSDELAEFIAKRTPGFVGGDMANLMQKLVLAKFKDKKKHLQIIVEDVLKTIKPASIQNTEVTVYKCEEKFDSLGGMSTLKSTLKASVIAGLKNPAVFSKFGLTLPKGILLYGPPGCAKTKIAKCLAAEANMTFIATSGAEVYSPYVGVAEKFISKIFDTARKNSPCLILLDEIDTLVGKRSSNSSSDVQMRILSTLLTEMDGIGVKMHEASGVVLTTENAILVVGATNRPDMIDDALMRPGRFDKLIHVPAPDIETRWNILNLNRNRMPCDENVDIQKLAEKTENFSGADICCMCNEAAIAAFTRDSNAETVTMDEFENVLTKTKPSLTKEQIQFYVDYETKNRKQ